MSKQLRAGLLAGIVMALAGSSGFAVDQKNIDRAIAAGVKALRDLQSEDSTWPPHRETGEASMIGSTALAGLTLLECGAKADDQAVLRAADAVRRASPKLTYNYAICLAILFFDRLGDANDIPLIESLTVRLLAGQSSSGGWSYYCPAVSDAEVRRLQAKLAARRELVGQREMLKPGGVKRTAKDLSPEIQRQLALLKRMGGMAVGMGSDNSNTQFATLALWVARRDGLPVEDALKRVGTRFRNSQHGDGGWGYFDASMKARGLMAHSTASMTCAGLLALAVANGETSEKAHERKPGAKQRDISKNSQVRKGLLALGTTIGRRPSDGPIGGRTYYFLWSLERVAVALDLKTIGKKDWYEWGAEILLANQQSDGSWQGSYGDCGADTCFALLFLKRANLAPDLTTQLAGRIPDPGERVLKRGELSESIALDKNVSLPSGLEDKNAKSNLDGRYPAEIAKDQQPQPATEAKQSQPVAKPQPAPARNEPAVSAAGSSAPNPAANAAGSPATRKPADAASEPIARMAADLANSTGRRHGQLLNAFRDGKGVEFTEALALAIPQMRGDLQRKTREALAERLTRMKDTTLKAYLGDENLEIRIAAARACAIKGSKSLVPQLIPLLRDPRGGVSEAAHQALKDLSRQDFGPKANASREERLQATREWTDWWNKQPKKDEP
jgi:hypothetical protein